jgi:zinc transport system ATP-binding protein
MSIPAASFEGVWFGYPGGVPALTDITLQVPEGDFLAVIGPNGGGKTTLLKLLLGLVRPSRGRVEVFGRPPGESGHSIGYVPQITTFRTDFPVSALDVVMMGTLGRGRHLWPHGAADRAAAHAKLERMGIADLAALPVGKLSGGQRQRVFVARALASEPRLLLLDEPAASVDPGTQESFFDLLREINSACTIVLVTHDVGSISGVVRTIACLNGRLVSHGDELPAEAFGEAYSCGIDLLSHGAPHRVLGRHAEDGDGHA